MEKILTNIKERVLYFAKYKGISIENFLLKIGITYGSFKGRAKQGSLNSDAIEKILTIYPDINPTWLLTDKGEMLNSQPVTRNVTNDKDSDKETLDILKKALTDNSEMISYLMNECRSKTNEIEQLKRDLAIYLDKEKKKDTVVNS